ncbi:class I SAM-dependent DNA methyltransferase [Peribacillus kribbensis]|uniref:class I SAM-dependent DNA methyltransferase n=1 Tax=Peribacillus kribbensis TaxID=356658 RepID=UPI000421C75C|nr:class I SAM-dependent methyltransferase [Peribacillus kribbensis]
MGREFIDLFDKWSETYDDTVIGHDIQYREVFRNYDEILSSVAARAKGHVVEFGVGTGNLTEKLIALGLTVTGFEPSPRMREKAAEKLLGNAVVKDGDFLEFTSPEPINTIVSTYAFHHLTDREKERAIKLYGSLLNKDDKIVFADTMYESIEALNKAVFDAEAAGFHDLANDLKTEYYTTIPFYRHALEKYGFVVTFERCNEFVWIFEAVKQ